MIVHLRSYSFIPHEGVFEVRKVTEERLREAVKKGTLKAGIRHKETFAYVKKILGVDYIKNNFDNINLANKNEILFAIRKEGKNEFVIWEIKGIIRDNRHHPIQEQED
jgi:hypothetical protein